jgi:alpha-beta hydrolase superfamily lysophospholipase
MGSFVTRTYLIDHSDRISAAILSGTTGSAGLLGKVGILLTGLIMIFKKKNSPSKLMNQMSFGDFNKSFKPALTNFDWLSRDAGVVDKYVNDPFCGGVFSVGFFKDMMIGLELVNKPENAKKLRKDLPLYLFSGDKDPVSKNGKQVNDVFEMYKNTGMKNVKMKLYPEARHETLNEINKEEVYNDVLGYLNSLN